MHQIGLCFLLALFCFEVPIRSALLTSTLTPAPEQIHLSLGTDSSHLVVTWVTLVRTKSSFVSYSTNGYHGFVRGEQSLFIDGGEEKRTIFVHRATLNDLIPMKVYTYRCGNEYVWSRNFTFRVLPADAKWQPRLVVLGDMGTQNNRALPELIRQVLDDRYDMAIHAGDFAYNLDTDDGRNGDLFMRQIEPIASRIPYMTAVGNHEFAYNFSHYKARFSMPGGDGNAMFYSFNVGPAHIIVYSTEFYYNIYEGWRQPIRQYEWLRKDLQEANTEESRAIRPWIITVAHRPMYCSNAVEAINCANVDNFVRTGYPYMENGLKKYLLGLEELFYEQGVDLIISAHMHSYERLWPVYNRTVCNATGKNPYYNPPAPVHIITGSAGSDEGVDPFIPGGFPWSAFRTDDYGFTRMNIWNHSHISIEQISVSEDPPAVIDSFTITSETHGANRFLCHRNGNS